MGPSWSHIQSFWLYMIFAPESIHTKVSPNENSELVAVSTLVSEKSCTYSGIEKNPVRYIYIYRCDFLTRADWIWGRLIYKGNLKNKGHGRCPANTRTDLGLTLYLLGQFFALYTLVLLFFALIQPLGPHLWAQFRRFSVLSAQKAHSG